MENLPKDKLVKKPDSADTKDDTQNGGISGFQVGQYQYLHSGPLPSPQAMKAYQALLPDAPERIFKQWEEETHHRQSYENKALAASIADSKWGYSAAIIFVVLALLLTAFAIWMEQPWVATILGGGTIGSVVWAFLKQRDYSMDDTKAYQLEENKQETALSLEADPVTTH